MFGEEFFFFFFLSARGKEKEKGVGLLLCVGADKFESSRTFRASVCSSGGVQHLMMESYKKQNRALCCAVGCHVQEKTAVAFLYIFRRTLWPQRESRRTRSCS